MSVHPPKRTPHTQTVHGHFTVRTVARGGEAEADSGEFDAHIQTTMLFKCDNIIVYTLHL